MAWSNEKIFFALSQLPDDIYRLRAAEGEWPVGKILNHLFAAAEWYRFLLTGEPWTEIQKITSGKKLLELQPYCARLDQALIAESKEDDAVITYTDDDGAKKSTTRSMILSQAVTHTAEHKGQLATILRTNGFEINLDMFDVWSYESHTK
jgi:uncharacterized damage-inducible protein DinB